MKSLGFLFSISAAVTWGVVYTIDQKVLKAVTPGSLLFIDAVLIFVVLFGYLIFKESLSWWFAFGALLVFAGTATIIKFA